MRWSDIPKNPESKVLRQFAGVWLIFFLVLSYWQGFAKERPTVGIILAVAAVVIGIAGLIRPSVVRPIFVGWMIVVFPIGWLVSHLILGTVYYLLFVPIGLFFRLRGRDALHLKLEPTSDSYWQVKPSTTDIRSYFRQF